MKQATTYSMLLLTSLFLALAPLAAASPSPARGGPSHIAQVFASPLPAPAPADGESAELLDLSSVSVAVQADYSDVSTNHAHAPSIHYLAATGIFEGTDCGLNRFCPNEPIDRKTAAVWVVRVLDGRDPPPGPSRFADANSLLWEFWPPFIERMADLGVTQGCGDGTNFCPDAPVTRAEMAVFLTRAFKLPDGPDPGFSDAHRHWAADSIAALAASGITRGCGDGSRFCPEDPTSRAEMATFLDRALIHSQIEEAPLDQE